MNLMKPCWLAARECVQRGSRTPLRVCVPSPSLPLPLPTLSPSFPLPPIYIFLPFPGSPSRTTVAVHVTRLAQRWARFRLVASRRGSLAAGKLQGAS